MIERQSTASGARFAFTDRWGGVSAAPYESLNLGGAVGDDPSAVLANRKLAAEAAGLDPASVRWLHQVHGSRVVVAGDPWPDGVAPEADGVVTARRGLALAVLTADCTPVLLADPVAGIVGAAHAGRPGLLAGVVPETVAAMCALGAEPGRIAARTGPSVCGRCYEVPGEMRDDAEGRVPGCAATTRVGTPAVDIPAGVLIQLNAAGVTDVTLSPVCTLESADHFSHRRERPTGRQASYVWLAAS
ncbi:peptidoglycan editing factor PgeF [Streptomyces radicis]|uniref:Purine nucleoside phosphorylase n=1 Tax=Streptomyces radicis TaxID=1750517 RepID=A0A3A9VYU5_9ACTN|nr:peptidoglycan editing factor PgeF [Streptomyces radicis]RKN06101.1 peptidoglycan editing factor PgeF [Streptomyces radicis]RKN18470.1 peptidoglycan editing factor PgeF [Streptomyces radicis]